MSKIGRVIVLWITGLILLVFARLPMVMEYAGRIIFRFSDTGSLLEDRDPAYRIYTRYRYAYDTYGYLFLSATEDGGEKKTGDGDREERWKETAGEQLLTKQPANQEKPDEEADSRPSLAQLEDYDFLMKHFYSVHTSTTAPRQLMRADKFLGTDLSLPKDKAVPQILIYHTHSQETYADYGPENPEATVVGIGNYLTELLEARGWNVIHDVSTYDIQGGSLDRNRAYTYSLEGVEKILADHPSIQVVLDLHRDGVGEKVRLVSQVAGKQTANIMFFQGMSRTPEGEIEYLPNPNLEGNLAFAFQMQFAAAGHYPGFTRKIYLKGLRYNLHLRPRAALIEVGAQTNTYEEALNAMEPLSEVLDMVLQGK